MRRRQFLQLAASAAAGAMVHHASADHAAHFSLRIAPVSFERAPGVVVTTTGYHGLQDSFTVTDTTAVGISGWLTSDGPKEVIHVLLEKRPEEPRSYPEMEFPRLQPGRQYRLRIMNATPSDLSIHLPGQPVELTRVDQKPISGTFTNTIRLSRYGVVEADLVGV